LRADQGGVKLPLTPKISAAHLSGSGELRNPKLWK
jgi:hypothetical protein